MDTQRKEKKREPNDATVTVEAARRHALEQRLTDKIDRYQATVDRLLAKMTHVDAKRAKVRKKIAR